MSPGKKFSSRAGSSAGRGRSGGTKKSFGKGGASAKKFSSSRGGAKPFGKRDDRADKPYSDRPKAYKRSDDRSDFKKPFDKKFSSDRSKPFAKRDDRDERPSRDRSSSSPRSDDRRDFKKPYEKKFSSDRGERKPYTKRTDSDRKPYGDRDDKKGFVKYGDKKFSADRGERKPFTRRDDRDEKPRSDRGGSFGRSDDRKDFKKPFDKKFSSDRGERKPFARRDDRDEKPSRDRSESYDRSDNKKDFKKPFDKKFSTERGDRKPFVKKADRDKKISEESSEIFRPTDDGKDFIKHDEKPKRRRSDESTQYSDRKPRSSDSPSRAKAKPDRNERDLFSDIEGETSPGETDRKWNRKSGHEFYGDKKPKRNDRDRKPRAESYKTNDDGSIRLNKYISNSGICSRREADELITAGVVSVNGQIMTELGYKVKPGDEVKYNNETLRTEKLVYILVNKPKDFITTVDDPQDRKTVMWLIKDACRERVYPVGRLDRNTTGVLLFTNDGELAKKLTHPSFEIQKIYRVELDIP